MDWDYRGIWFFGEIEHVVETLLYFINKDTKNKLLKQIRFAAHLYRISRDKVIRAKETNLIVLSNIYGPLAVKESNFFDIIKSNLDEYNKTIFGTNKIDSKEKETSIEEAISFLKG